MPDCGASITQGHGINKPTSGFGIGAAVLFIQQFWVHYNPSLQPKITTERSKGQLTLSRLISELLGGQWSLQEE